MVLTRFPAGFFALARWIFHAGVLDFSCSIFHLRVLDFSFVLMRARFFMLDFSAQHVLDFSCQRARFFIWHTCSIFRAYSCSIFRLHLLDFSCSIFHHLHQCLWRTLVNAIFSIRTSLMLLYRFVDTLVILLY